VDFNHIDLEIAGRRETESYDPILFQSCFILDLNALVHCLLRRSIILKPDRLGDLSNRHGLLGSIEWRCFAWLRLGVKKLKRRTKDQSDECGGFVQKLSLTGEQFTLTHS
jgi:hypothetical protein